MEGVRGAILVSFGGRTELAGVRKARSGWGLRAAAAEEEEAENAMYGLRPLDIRKMGKFLMALRLELCVTQTEEMDDVYLCFCGGCVCVLLGLFKKLN